MPEGRILQLIAGQLAALVEQRSPKRTASSVLLRLCVVGR
jgi:hypothetical protein